MIRLIAAVDRKNGIAKKGVIPWYIPEDNDYFTSQTKLYGGNVLTGMTTFKNTYRGPLKDRQNFILTHETTPVDGVTLVHDLKACLEDFKDRELWVAGGANVFAQVIELGRADEIYLTRVDADFGCDQFFTEYAGFSLKSESEVAEQNGFKFSYLVYQKDRG